MSVLLSPTCTCLYCYHTVHVCPVITDMCISLLFPFWPVHVSSVTTFTCISPYCYHTDLYLSVLWPHRLLVPVYCYHTDLSQSLLLPHWHVPVSIVTTDLYLSTVATLTCACLYFTTLTCSCLLPCWPVHVCSVCVSTVLLPHWPVAVSAITTLTCTCLYWPASVYCYHPDLYYHHYLHMSVLLTLTYTCLYCYHTVHVCPVITDMCISLLLPFWPVHVSSVTTLICISPHCYHTDLYLSVLWPHRLPVPVYCYHTDLSQSLLLPHWHVSVSTVTPDLYLSLLLSNWPVPVSTFATLSCACLYCYHRHPVPIYCYHTDHTCDIFLGSNREICNFW